MRRTLLLAFALAVAPAVHAGLGLTEIAGPDADHPVTVFYPTAQADQPVQLGPFNLQVARNAVPLRGNGRLVVLSHGSGGNALTYTELARRLVDAGFVVASPLHEGDNYRTTSDAGPVAWRRRPLEITRAIDTMGRDPRFGPLLALDKVGVHGMSAGGHTTLTLAGGRWSPSVLLRHCETRLDEDFTSCAGPSTLLKGDAFDTIKRTVTLGILRSRLDDTRWYAHTDARIAAAVAEVPFAADFDMASLASPPIPLGIVQAGQDRWLAPRFHSGQVLAACAACERLADEPTAGHASFLSPQVPPEALSGLLRTLLTDPPGFDRARVAPVHARITGFFTRHLAP
jgi:predicted dienelactone hydrolase